MYVRDIATGLLQRGHTPVAFSTVLGDVAREMRALTIPVIDNLDVLTNAPDIIHGQHHVETMIAMLHFPDTPAVYFCHGWLPWEENPPRFPRIFRYVAVDHTTRDRLVFENGISESRVSVLLNFVDLERFKPRGPLPSRPARALFFTNDAEEQTIRVVREACRRADIALDVMGASSGTACGAPERALGGYDLVFAKGRSAIEAMAVGAAVVICDISAIGSMVTMCEFDRLRPLNFGIRALKEPINQDSVEREISRYDATDATRVSERIRSTAGRDSVIDNILLLYQEVIAEFERTERDVPAEERAASEYLRWLSPRLKEYERLNAVVAACEQHIRASESSLAQQLAEKEAQLARITGTVGWRLLSLYGR